MREHQQTEEITLLLKEILLLLRNRLPFSPEQRPVDDQLPPWFEKRSSGNDTHSGTTNQNSR